jgi:hypothetical protein
MKKNKKVPKEITPVNVRPSLAGHDEATFYIEQKSLDALRRKSEEHLIEMPVLLAVYKRGLDSWKENPKNLTKEQVAFGRVNSFLSGGKAAELDSELYEEYQKRKTVLEKFYNIVVKAGQFKTKNIMTVDAKDEADAYNKAHKLYAGKSGHVRTNKIKNKIRQQYAVQENKRVYEPRGKVTKGTIGRAFAANFASALTAPTIDKMHIHGVQRVIDHPPKAAKPEKHPTQDKNHPLGNYTKDQKASAKGATPAQGNRAAARKFAKLKAASPNEKSGAAPRTTGINMSKSDHKAPVSVKGNRAADNSAAKKITGLKGVSPDQSSGAAPRTTKPSFSLKDPKNVKTADPNKAKNTQASKALGKLNAPSPDQSSGAAPRSTRPTFSLKDPKHVKAAEFSKAKNSQASKKLGKMHAPSPGETSGTDTRKTAINFAKSDQKGYGNTKAGSVKKGNAAAGKKLGSINTTPVANKMASSPAATASKAPGKAKPRTLGQIKGTSQKPASVVGKVSGSQAPTINAPAKSTAFGQNTPNFLSKGKPVEKTAQAPANKPMAKKKPNAAAPKPSTAFGNDTPSFMNKPTKKPTSSAASLKQRIRNART